VESDEQMASTTYVTRTQMPPAQSQSVAMPAKTSAQPAPPEQAMQIPENTVLRQSALAQSLSELQKPKLLFRHPTVPT
jgi:hypothetical protein